MSNKKELIEASQKLKDSIENQIGDLKGKFDKYGKLSLWVGGGLLAVYLLSKAFSDNDEVPEEEVKTEKKKKKAVSNSQSAQANFLTDTLKEQAIIYGLGLAAQQLKAFLQKLNEGEQEENSH